MRARHTTRCLGAQSLNMARRRWLGSLQTLATAHEEGRASPTVQLNLATALTQASRLAEPPSKSQRATGSAARR